MQRKNRCQVHPAVRAGPTLPIRNLPCFLTIGRVPGTHSQLQPSDRTMTTTQSHTWRRLLQSVANLCTYQYCSKTRVLPAPVATACSRNVAHGCVAKSEYRAKSSALCIVPTALLCTQSCPDMPKGEATTAGSDAAAVSQQLLRA